MALCCASREKMRRLSLPPPPTPPLMLSTLNESLCALCNSLQLLRGSKTYTTIDTQKSGVKFTTSELRDASRRTSRANACVDGAGYTECKDLYEETQKGLVKDMIGTICHMSCC